MSISGPMYTIGAVGGIKFNSFIKSDLEFYYATDIGKNTYNGAIQMTDFLGQKTTIPLIAKSNDYYLSIAYRVGLTIFGDGIDEYFGLYLGMGYRYLNNQIRDTSAYSRKQSYFYMPIGARIKVRLNKKIRLKLDGELRAMLLGSNTSAFRDIGYDNNLHFIQANGSGSRITLGAEFFVTKKTFLFIQGTFDYWGIGKSNVLAAYKGGMLADYFVEPENNTIVYGFEIGYSF